jgi:signal transduction histidine kinase
MTGDRRLSQARSRALSTLRANNPLQRWLPSAQADPSARMFAGIRLRMTLLYSAILAVILVAAGGLLYFGMQRVLLDPVIAQARQEVAMDQAGSWQPGIGSRGCAHGFNGPYYLIACYDSSANFLSGTKQPFVISSPASSSLARQALANGSAGTATDTTTVQVVQENRQGPPDQGSGSSSVTQTRTVLRYAAVVSDASNSQILGVVEVGSDITGEAQALHTLLTLLLIVGGITLVGCGVGGALLAERTLAPARQAFARQQAFIADAGHELRTPLTLLRANAEVLLRDRRRLEPDDAQLLDDIVAEVAHMGSLAENLLALARLDSGTIHLEQEVVNLADLADEAARQAHALAEERQVTLTVERADGSGLAADLPPSAETLVIGDATQLREVTLNLVDNAIKYNRPGGAVVLRTFHEGEQAVLEVRDTGVGIAPEHLAHLGERFYRVDKARSRQMGGAGLGIAIAHRIAALHHGSLALSSMPNQGTTATLRLPLAE